jgi:hypothetical protein
LLHADDPVDKCRVIALIGDLRDGRFDLYQTGHPVRGQQCGTRHSSP